MPPPTQSTETIQKEIPKVGLERVIPCPCPCPECTPRSIPNPGATQEVRETMVGHGHQMQWFKPLSWVKGCVCAHGKPPPSPELPAREPVMMGSCQNLLYWPICLVTVLGGYANLQSRPHHDHTMRRVFCLPLLFFQSGRLLFGICAPQRSEPIRCQRHSTFFEKKFASASDLRRSGPYPKMPGSCWWSIPPMH